MSPTLRFLGAAVLLAALPPLSTAQGTTSGGEAGSTHLVYQNGSLVRLGSPPLNCPYVPPNGGSVTGGDYRGNDRTTWYGVDHLGQAFSIDLATCNPTQRGTMGSAWTGATYDYVDDTFYGLQVTSCGSGSRLYELDFDAVTATPVGPIDPTSPCGVALGAHPTTGQLYSYDIVTDQLYAVSKSTGLSTAVGLLGFDSSFGGGMDLNADTGTCYLYAFNNITFMAELRTCNLATGNTTLVGTIGPGLSSAVSTGSAEGLLPSDCDIEFLAADLAYDAGTRRLTVSVTVRHNGNAPNGARLELDYNRQGGPPTGTRVLGSGTLPAGATVSRTVTLRVPAGAPDGNYDLTLRLIDPTTGAECGSYQKTIAISAPRLGGAAAGRDFEVEAVADLSPAASAVGSGVAVAPNPFARQATISYDVAAPSDVRLAVYDVLGREVAVLADGPTEAGTHTATLEARSLAAGTYLWRLALGDDVQMGLVTLTR